MWEEKRSPNSKKEKTRTKGMPSVALVPESWQVARSLHHTRTCEREHADGNLRSLRITFTISLVGSVLKVEMVVSSKGLTTNKTIAYGRYGVMHLHI